VGFGKRVPVQEGNGGKCVHIDGDPKVKVLESGERGKVRAY
jgi:hypothetical protein